MLYLSAMANYFISTLFVCFMALSSPCLAQEKEAEVEAAVREFFEAFHDRDTASLKSMMAQGVILQTIKPTIDGDVVIQSSELATFLQGLASIPDSVDYREELLEIAVSRDGPLAHAWTPYKFYINGGVRHCGANSFQWIRQQGSWKVIYLVDTRRKLPCN